MSTHPVTVDLLRDVLAAFNAHDLDRIMTFFAEDCSFDMPRGSQPFGTRYIGKAEVRAGLASRFRAFRTCTTATMSIGRVAIRRCPVGC